MHEKTFSLIPEPPALQVGCLPSNILTFTFSAAPKSSGGAFMLRKVVKVHNFPPDRPCDSVTTGGGGGNADRQKNKRRKHVVFFFNKREKQVRKVFVGQPSAAVAKLARVLHRIHPYS